MARAPFQPVGDQARWKTVYELLGKLEPDGVLAFEDMGKALGLDPVAEKRQIAAAARRAAQRYERDNNRAVVAVPGKGYRIAQPADHIALAHGDQRRASRALQRGYDRVATVDLNQVEDPTTRQSLELLAQGFALQIDFNRRVEARVARQEAVLETVEQRVVRSETQLDAVLSRLERLEQERVAQGGKELVE